jgi:hypothetical protein
MKTIPEIYEMHYLEALRKVYQYKSQEHYCMVAVITANSYKQSIQNNGPMVVSLTFKQVEPYDAILGKALWQLQTKITIIPNE